MLGETVTETWFGNIWKSSRRSVSWEPERPVLGILAFEVSRLMSKMVSLWHCLADGQMVSLREGVAYSVGIHRLVSDDENHLMDLALAEMIENLKSVMKSVVILGKKCTDPRYHNLEQVFYDLGEIDPKWSGWQYKPKKMEKKVKKMERFVAATEQLHQEIEVLAELEQSLRRMQSAADSNQVKLLEFQQKVVRQRQEVKNLRDMSPWGRTYDCMARLLLKCIFSIIERIKSVYGIKYIRNAEGSNDYEQINGDCLIRSNSISAVVRGSIYPSEVKAFRFTVPLGRSFSNLGLGCDKQKLKNMKSHSRSQSSVFFDKQHPAKSRIFAPVGFAGCMTSGRESHVVESYTPLSNTSFGSNDASLKEGNETKDTRGLLVQYNNRSSSKVSFLNSKSHLLNGSPSTLGHAALALHYANIIILIEKLAQSPHLISTDARDDLYSMLSTNIKSSLRAKLKTFSVPLTASIHDTTLAAEWSLAIENILEWLSPLAHNMVKWQSERNFERQRLICRSSVLLVQTLYFANQVETESAIVELLVGLNYLSRFGREANRAPFIDPSCNRAYDGQ